MDLLIVTALTDEAQVVRAVLDTFAQPIADRPIRRYRYSRGDGSPLEIGIASAHQMGAVSMGVFAASLFENLKPRSTSLVGIAAAVDQSAVDLGDVPFSSHVIAYDDIAVEGGTLRFRTEGFQVDPLMRRAAGELRVSQESYAAWQEDCLRTIKPVLSALRKLRRQQVALYPVTNAPHLIVDVTAGGPFLLRDQDFRDSLKDSRQLRTPLPNTIRVESPVHPKLVSAEMESHGFMRAAHEYGVPATVLKGISDLGDPNKRKLETDTGGFFRAYACSNAVVSLLHIVALRATLGSLPHVEPRPEGRATARVAVVSAAVAATLMRIVDEVIGENAKGIARVRERKPEDDARDRAFEELRAKYAEELGSFDGATIENESFLRDEFVRLMVENDLETPYLASSLASREYDPRVTLVLLKDPKLRAEICWPHFLVAQKLKIILALEGQRKGASKTVGYLSGADDVCRVCRARMVYHQLLTTLATDKQGGEHLFRPHALICHSCTRVRYHRLELMTI